MPSLGLLRRHVGGFNSQGRDDIGKIPSKNGQWEKTMDQPWKVWGWLIFKQSHCLLILGDACGMFLLLSHEVRDSYGMFDEIRNQGFTHQAGLLRPNNHEIGDEIILGSRKFSPRTKVRLMAQYQLWYINGCVLPFWLPIWSDTNNDP